MWFGLETKCDSWLASPKGARDLENICPKIINNPSFESYNKTRKFVRSCYIILINTIKLGFR